MSSEGFYYNGTKLDNTSTSTFTNSLSATIFAIKQANNPTQVLNRNPQMKVYSCKIWQSNTLVNNFIPCYRISDNVIGMYDLVSNTFFTNAGSGMFTKGNNAPTPDTPIDIEVVTGTQEVKVENVNLATTPTYINYNVNSDGFGTSNGYAVSNKLYVGDNTKFYYGLLENFENVGDNYLRIGFFKSDGTFISRNMQSNITASQLNSINIPANTAYIMVGASNDTSYGLWKEIDKVCWGFSTDIKVPHQEQTQTLSLGDIELCKIGTYQDYLYKSNDKWYKKKQIEKVVLNGSETGWAVNGSVFYGQITNIMRSKIQMYSNFYSYKNVAWTGLDNNEMTNDNASNTIFIKDTRYTVLNDFKNFLSNNNMELYYVLATPNDIEITNSSLIQQLDNLEKLKSYNGTTNISSSGSLPMILNVSALKGES